MRKIRFLSVFVLLALVAGITSWQLVKSRHRLGGPGPTQERTGHYFVAIGQEPPPAQIQVDGRLITLERGKNVHTQTYDLLVQDPEFASRMDWVFMDGMWIPLARGVAEPLVEDWPPLPTPEYAPESGPCTLTLLVPAYSQCASPSPAVVLPDLSPLPDGWIAFRTPEGRLALVSPDGSRRVNLTWTYQQGELWGYAWSPDGRQIAFTLGSYYLHGLPGAQLALVSLEDSRFITLTPPGAVDREFTWSQDGRFLAYLWRTNPQEERPPLALRVMDLTTGQVITVTTFSNQLLPEPEVPSLCPQAFPYPLLPVCMGSRACFLDIWDVQTGQKVATLGSTSYLGCGCGYMWHPKGELLFMPKVEGRKEGIRQEGVEEEVIHPLSLAMWRRGDEGPTVILEGTKRRSYLPVQWLPDGQLMVRAMEWEKDEYEGPAEPERVEYRLFSADEAGGIREAEGNLPWWAADGFFKRLAETGIPRGSQTPPARVEDWAVGPDDATVIFTWRWFEGGESKSAIYLWRGEGEPIHLATGTGPQWQPKQMQP